MNPQPTVSIVMATYNGEKYLREQLDSLLEQTFPFTELIVQDDCSTDSTRDIVKQYAARDPRIKLFLNEQNLGWNQNFITALSRSKCDFIAICDQDDIWYPQKLEKQLRQIGDNALCFCYRDKDADYNNRGKVVGTPQPDPESLLFTSHIPGHDILIPRSLLGKIDTWHPQIPYDWWLAVQAHLCGTVTFVPEQLNWHRPHSGSASAQLKKDEWAKADRISWQPYLYGWKAYAQLQKSTERQWFYHYVFSKTSSGHLPLVHRMARLMYSSSLLSLLRLCVLSMIYRARVHRRFAGGKGLRWVLNLVRGFFYPLMWAYNDNASFIPKPASSTPKN